MATLGLAMFLLLCAMILTGSLTGSSVSAAAPVKSEQSWTQAPLGMTEAYTGFLPSTMRHFCVYTPTSPFALQVAALHEIDTGALLAERARPATQEEILAVYQATYASLLDALKESGAGWSRVRINWSEVQRSAPPAPYSWSWYDTKLQLVAGTGVQLIATIADPPAWASTTSCPPIASNKMDEFAQFMKDLVLRYKQPPYNIKVWEMSNEPDGTVPSYISGLDCWGDNGAAYAQMLAKAYSAIKSADSEAIVIMGGVAYENFTEHTGGMFNRYFVDSVMSAGGGASVDAVSFHYFNDYHWEWERWDPNSEPRLRGWLPAPTCGDVDDGIGTSYYAGGIDVIAKTTHFRNRISTCFDVNKPVWITELAAHGYPDDNQSLGDQARYVIQGHVRALAAGVKNITWFALVSPPYDPFEQGLLYQNTWAPKPGYYAYQTLTRELSIYTYYRTIGGVAGEAYVFRNPCLPEKTVAWGTGTLSLSSAPRLMLTDRNGSISYVNDGGQGDLDGARNNIVKIQLTSEPKFIVVVAN